MYYAQVSVYFSSSLYSSLTVLDIHCSVRFEYKAFAVMIIKDLLAYHVQSQIPVTRTSGAKTVKAIPEIDKWAIRRDDLKLGRKLGRGAFGEVCEAMLEKVAVKTCRETIPQSEKRKFLMEAEILKQDDHPNDVVKLIGVCAEKDPMFITDHGDVTRRGAARLPPWQA